MNIDTTALIIGVIAGAFGTGYFIYGKKASMAMPMICGFALCVYPYFFDNVIYLIVFGVFLAILPFFFRF